LTPKTTSYASPYRDWEVSFEHWGLIDSILQPLDLCILCYNKSIPDRVDASKITIREKQQVPPDCLYIIMEYCESTLIEAIEGADDKTIWTFFSQTVKGLAHLRGHGHGIIHRDLKPNNIFAHEGIVRIGDLGLATTTTTSSTTTRTTGHGKTTSSSSDPQPSKKSFDVGTFLYQAPEVATTTGNHGYDEKCDIYSLGVLLVEIFSKFDTAMERAKVL
jgi:translation initiation factor 2-alpha kinase 4